LNGGITAIELPGNYQGIPRDKLLIVGSLAIQIVFNNLPTQVKEVLGEEKGRVAAAMVKTIASQKLHLPE
jgi:hypothetical protein